MAETIEYVKYRGRNRKVKIRFPRLGMITLIMGHQLRGGVLTEITRTVSVTEVDTNISVCADTETNGAVGRETTARRAGVRISNRLRSLTQVTA